MDYDDFWGEPIHIYNDDDALDDGVLIDISSLGLSHNDKPINRITRTLYAELEPFLLELPEETVTLDGRTVTIPGLAKMESLAKMMKTKLRFARLVERIWVMLPNIWMVENEAGGWTIMLPSDY